MNARPHGASVVPTVPVTTTHELRVSGNEETTRPRAVSVQSGRARNAAATYMTNAVDSRTCSIRSKLPRRTTNATNTAATGTDAYRLIPASSRPAATPAN